MQMGEMRRQGRRIERERADVFAEEARGLTENGREMEGDKAVDCSRNERTPDQGRLRGSGPDGV